MSYYYVTSHLSKPTRVQSQCVDVFGFGNVLGGVVVLQWSSQLPTHTATTCTLRYWCNL